MDMFRCIVRPIRSGNRAMSVPCVCGSVAPEKRLEDAGIELREHVTFVRLVWICSDALSGRSDRETGLCLCLACAGASLLKRDWRMLALSCASMLPSFAWYGYVQMHCPADPSSNLLRLPLTDLVQNLLHHDASYVNSGRSFVEVLYYMAVFGMLLAFFLAIRFAFKDWTSAEGLAALAFTMTGLLLQPSGLWVQPYYFGDRK